MITLLPNSTWLNGIVYDERHEGAGRIDGKPAPTVTQILKAAGLTGQFDQVKPHVLERKASLGNAVHAATHYHDEGDLDETTVTDEARLRLDAWKWFRENRRFEPILLESVICSRQYHYIGKLDRFGYADGRYDRLVLPDIKTGKPQRADLQTMAYLLALLEQYPELRGCIVERWAIELLPTRRYTVHPFPDRGRTGRQDRIEFLGAAAQVQERMALNGGQPCWT